MAAELHDVPFEIPGVLRKSDDAEKIADVVKRSAVKNPDTPQGAGKRPGKLRFRPLVAAALLVGLAGGAALALGVPDMMVADEPETRPVATQLIVTDPQPVSATENTVRATAAISGTPESAAKTEPFNTATPEQIAEAKNRLRLAFASGNTSAAPAPATTSEGAAAPVYPQAAPAQAAATAPLPDASLPGSGLPAGLTTPAYALSISSANRSGLSSVSASVSADGSDSEAIAANNSPGAVVSAKEAGTAPVETASAQDVRAYANSGQTTASVNMRLSEKKNSEIIAVIPANTTVSFNECGKWWCGIEYDGKTGFVGQRFVERAAQ
nr:SH3 domain-containing protein [uncultured Roseibium sp.]